MSSVLDSVGVSTGSAAFTPPAIDGNLTGKHIVSVEQFARPDLDELIKVATDLRNRVRTGDQSVLKLCRRRIMATLFFEASTRTDMSFQAAMLRLGGEVVSTAGGVKLVEPGLDLGVCLAVVSALRNQPMPADVAVFGEVGLGGELRQVGQAARRLTEAARLGFSRVIVPANSPDGDDDIRVIRAKTLSEAIAAAGLQGAPG